MILKRPYAFLIKHFQKIHVILLILCSYVFYKNTKFSSFISDYISLGTYNEAIDSVDNYVGITFYIVSICILLIAGIVIYLLSYKKKPYRFYIFVILEYLFMVIVFWFGADYFHTLTSAVSITKIMAIRDLIFISSLPQYIILVMLLIRSLGVDLKKFGFSDDKEVLGLDEKDNEEFEFEVNVDRDKYRREVKKKLRFFGYFYQENKKAIQIAIVISFVGFVGFSMYYFGIENRIYKMGEKFNANQYTIQVNKGYVTNKDYAGNFILGENSNKKFVILDITVANNSSSREMNVDRFHLLNGLSSSNYTLKYNNSFTDLGTPYEKSEFKRGESKNFLLVYQVDANLKNDEFVLTYQEVINSQMIEVKKIKMELEDISNPLEYQKKNINQEMTIVYPNREKRVIEFESLNYLSEATYYYEKCSISSCFVTTDIVKAKQDQTLAVLSFVSSDFDTSELVDFSVRYGTIKYINNKETRVVSINSAVNRNYHGNYLYFSVPADVKNSSEVDLVFTVRDKQFVYKLK